MSNILLRLGINPAVLTHFLPYLDTLTENSAAFRYHDGSNEDLELFQERNYRIPCGRAVWKAHPSFTPFVRQHFLFYSALEALCFFSLYPQWLHCPSGIAVTALGLSPDPKHVKRLRIALPNAQLHFAFGNDLPGQLLDCQIPLWLTGRQWRFAYHQSQLHIDDGRRSYWIPAENFSCIAVLGAGHARRFKKEKPRGGCASFYEQLKYP